MIYNLLISEHPVSNIVRILPFSFLCGGLFTLRQLRKYSLRNIREIFIKPLFCCYLAGLASLLLAPNNFWLAIWFYLFNGFHGTTIGPLFTFEYNLVPSIISLLQGKLSLGAWSKMLLLGNILIFFPMGTFLPLLFSKVNTKKLIIIAGAIPICIEVVQLYVGRAFDIDDVLANSLGIFLGYCTWAVARFLFSEHFDKAII